MGTERTAPAPLNSQIADTSPAQLAKQALRRLATDKLEPTPENYSRAYRSIAGDGQAAASMLPKPVLPLLERLVAAAGAHLSAEARQELTKTLFEGHWQQAERMLEKLSGRDAAAAQAASLASLIERIVNGLERGGRNWTNARKKGSLLKVLSGSRADTQRLHQRLSQLVTSWESDSADELADPNGRSSEATAELPAAARDAVADGGHKAAEVAERSPSEAMQAWPSVVQTLSGSVLKAFPAGEPHYASLLENLSGLIDQICLNGATSANAEELSRLCERAGWALQSRQSVFEQLGGLCHELTASLGDLAEDESWTKGQLEAMRLKLEDGLTPRGVRSVSELLRHTREHHRALRSERAQAHHMLKDLINHMLQDLGELSRQTGGFHDNIGRLAGAIEHADSLEGLTSVVREMVEETLSVRTLVGQTQQRLQTEHARASSLSGRVEELETELRRLSDEVTTDQLTQIANRRGLLQIFEGERARMERDEQTLAVGLLDIDNFKRLNDELGHSVGDQALKSLAAAANEALRPTDRVARYGGEEFVVLLPATAVEEAQQILTRLQRSLSGGLFMHDEKNVMVTFSAGVTAYRFGESLEQALERADEALYVAKRTGKNRTCIC